MSLFEGVGQLLPGDFAGLLMSRPGSSQLGTLVAKRCRRGFLEVYRVPRKTDAEKTGYSTRAVTREGADAYLFKLDS